MPRGKFFDLTDLRTYRLTVIARYGTTSNGEARWLCICDCGNHCLVSAYKLKTGHTKSCGCIQSEVTILRNQSTLTHGCSRNPEFRSTYKAWDSMKQRCCNPNDHAYKDYGGRGIKICERWINSFENFFTDMGVRPIGMTGKRPTYSIDRIDNDGNYTPTNCRWATGHQQQTNQRRSRQTEPAHNAPPFNSYISSSRRYPLASSAAFFAIPRPCFPSRLNISFLCIVFA